MFTQNLVDLDRDKITHDLIIGSLCNYDFAINTWARYLKARACSTEIKDERI